MRKILFAAAVFAAFSASAFAADGNEGLLDSKGAAVDAGGSPITTSYCNQLNKVLTAQRNASEDQLASMAAQLTIFNVKAIEMQGQIENLKGELKKAKEEASRSESNSQK